MTPTMVVAGAGGSVGVALCRLLRDRGWRVLALGRDRARLEVELAGVADELVALDLGDPASVARHLSGLGADALVYNAGQIDLLPLLETTPQQFEASWRTNALGAFLCARSLAAAMTARGEGSMIFMGATASVRGGRRSAAFASAKHALRGLASSLAKELGPAGVHVAHLIVDGKIWGERTRARFSEIRQDECIDATAIAETIWGLMMQPRSAWTFELDIRPSVEKWS